MRIFIDTNIILDMLEPTRTGSEYTMMLFEQARKRILELFVTTQSIIDSYYIGSKMGCSRQEIDTLITWILTHANVRAIDSADVKRAVESGVDDIEDEAQVYLADDSGCNFFITKDKGLLKREQFEGISFNTPEQLVGYMM